MPVEYDVVIVGAGCAGLAAGRALAAAGARTVIVEARERVGGRIFTQHATSAAGPVAVELGAEFIHGLPRSSWSIVEEAKLGAYELAGSSLIWSDGKLAEPGAEFGHTHGVLCEMIEWLSREPAGRDLSFADYLKTRGIDGPAAAQATRFVEGFNAADHHRIGIAALAKQQRAEDLIDADRLFRVHAGYAALPGFLADQFARAGGELLLGAPVSRIGWQRGSVAVSAGVDASRRELRARRALITVPLGVLHAGSVEFAPAPAAILEHAQRLAMGEAARIVIIFREAFWQDAAIPADELSFLFAPAEALPTWWTPMPNTAPAITAWTGGPKAAALRRLAAADRGAALELCLATLSKIFEVPHAQLAGLVTSWHYHDWHHDRFARGAYSYVPSGALDAPERMTRPVEDTLYFAGEHTDVTGHWGTVHAALDTGLRGAAQILAAAPG
jgi:monoamine oxidase